MRRASLALRLAVPSLAMTLAALLAISILSPAPTAGLSMPAPSAPRVTGGYLDPRDDSDRAPSHLSLLALGAKKVRAGFAGHSAEGRLDRHASNTIRPGRVWDFGRVKRDRTPAMKRMIRAVMAEYRREGRARVRVRAAKPGAVSHWRCRLTERTRQSRCRRLG